MREDVQRILDSASVVAINEGALKITGYHVLFAFSMSVDMGTGGELNRLGVSVLELSKLSKTSKRMEINPTYTESLTDLLGDVSEAISPRAFLRELLRTDPDARAAVFAIGRNPDTVLQGFNSVPLEIVKQVAKKQTPNIDKYCKDVTGQAERKELDPCIGREVEIERTIRVLARRRKNNPVLIAPAGTGKTALVEGLALSIVAKESRSKRLHGKRLVMIDLGLMLSGTKYRGMFEERLTGVIKELEENPEIIAFIDELHTIVGCGDSDGAQDAAQLLKPVLARGKIKIIGATTPQEFKAISKDPALSRRFQPVVLEPLKDEDVLKILKAVKGLYEDFHKVRFTKKALLAIIQVSKGIVGRHAPDVQIDLMDEAGAAADKKVIDEADIHKIFAQQVAANQNKNKKVGF